MVLDNSKVHHVILLEEFLHENSYRITLFFLPPYSPKMNVIECLWAG